METIVSRAGALDVHKAQVTACVRVPGRGRERAQEVAEFQTTVRGLLALRDWLKAHRVSQVAMEATGVYWKPVWAILEDEFDCLLVNARHVKQVPGRKTDVSDAAWLCQLLEAGLLRRSFVPPKPIRALRNLTRYRKAQIGERQREANRLHKLLEDTGIKLDCVASDILGASGRAMLDALVAGTTDPEVLAELAKGKLRAKIPVSPPCFVSRRGEMKRSVPQPRSPAGPSEERGVSMATDVARSGRSVGRPDGLARLTTETKHSSKTTEFWAMVAVIAEK
jgi:transposase